MSHVSRESEVVFDQQSSIDDQIAKFEKNLKATEKRNARLRELVETEERSQVFLSEEETFNYYNFPISVTKRTWKNSKHILNYQIKQ